jgi:GTP-binding protein SAR1
MTAWRCTSRRFTPVRVTRAWRLLCSPDSNVGVWFVCDTDSEELIIGKLRLRTFDLGGHETARRLWRDYFATVDGVVFVVDALDRERFPESKRELDTLLGYDELANVPFLVLGNKIDVPRAASEDELRAALGLYETYGKEARGDKDASIRPIELYMCSVVRRMGYADGFRWMAQFL